MGVHNFHSPLLSLNNLYIFISHQLKLFRDDTEEEEEEEERKREKCRLIQERIEHLTSYLDHITATSSDHLSRLRNELDWQTRLWQIELGSGGNIKFLAPVEGHWHRACTELVKSRFSAANWQVGVASEPGESPVINYNSGAFERETVSGKR